MLLAAALLTAGLVAAWELRWRAAGYRPSMDDTPDLWADARRRLEAAPPDQVVLVGASRVLFDLDLEVLERELGVRRPIQLATVGTNPLVHLEHVAAAEEVTGTVLCGVHPGLFFLPPGVAERYARRGFERYRKATPAQRIGAALWQELDARLALLNIDDLALRALIEELEVPQRTGVHVMRVPYIFSLDRERRGRMVPRLLEDAAFRERIQRLWIDMPRGPPPSPANRARGEGMRHQTLWRARAAVDRIRARGGQVIFLHLPASGELRELERRMSPRERTWDALLAVTGAPGIHVDDHPELAGFDCPEWSHLSAADSVEFTRRLAPHLARLLRPPAAP